MVTVWYLLFYLFAKNEKIKGGFTMQLIPSEKLVIGVSKEIIDGCPVIGVQRKEVGHKRYTHFFYNGATGG